MLEYNENEITVTEQIKIFQDFIDSNLHAKLLEIVRKGEKSITIDFNELAKFSPEISELLLNQPEEILRAFELAIEQFDLPVKVKNFRVRIKNLPKTQEIKISNIRSKDIGKFISVFGIVRQKSNVRPQVTLAKFECPSCGNILSVPQLDNKFREPLRCSCGRKGRFKLISKELVDAQRIVLEESPEDLEGGEQPKRVNVFLKEDLVSPISEKRASPGTKIIVNGILKEVPISLRTGGRSTRVDLMIEANYFEPVEEEFVEISISKQEEKKIIELSKDAKVYQKIIKSVAPSIYGHEKIKEAIMLQLFGGVRKKRTDGMIIRGDIHVLLVGDPGAGKSQLLKRVVVISPKARYVSGKGASGAGLTASVVKDEFLSGFSLEAGALVLANKGLCAIDELDKMSKEDRSAMHEALEQQTVTISKANIQATLRAETTVLAAANPKFGRFDPYGLISEQIDLPPTLINRFDLIFPVKDIPNKEKDVEMAKFILALHQTNEAGEEEIPTELLRKYIAYAKQKINPRLTDGAVEEIKDYYVKMRSSGSEESGVKTIPISARQLEALVRLAEASARVRLSNKVTKKDARRAIDLLHYSLEQIGLDIETGKIDIDRISTGIPASKRNKIVIIKEIISELEDKVGKTIPIEDIIKLAKEQSIGEDVVDEVMEKLKRSGDIFEPKRGFIQKI